MFLAVLRLFFALKTKIASPNEIGVRVKEDPEMNFGEDFFFFWRSPDFGQKNALNFGEDLFFFWRSPDFGQKNALDFSEDLFFLEIFGQKNALNLI